MSEWSQAHARLRAALEVAATGSAVWNAVDAFERSGGTGSAPSLAELRTAHRFLPLPCLDELFAEADPHRWATGPQFVLWSWLRKNQALYGTSEVCEAVEVALEDLWSLCRAHAP